MTHGTTRAKRQADRLRAAIRLQRGAASLDREDSETGRIRLEEATRLSVVSAHWGIATDIPVVTREIVFGRRVMRLLLRWYINPIVEQQNAYNSAVLNALRALRVESEDVDAHG